MSRVMRTLVLCTHLLLGLVIIPSHAANPPLGQGEIQETGPHYGIKASYPVLEDPGPAAAAANEVIGALVRGIIGPFRTDYAEAAAAADPKTPDWQGPDWSLTLEYAAPYRADRYLAIPFSGYSYTGGAHGMPIIEDLVIELTSGRRIPPEDLFAPGSDWLKALSERCFTALKGRDLLGQDDDWLRQGTAPKPENYQLLLPGPDGLTVSFAPYSVAPYAAGTQEVLIPYADLAGILNPRLFPQ